MKEKIDILIELENILAMEQLEINSKTLSIRETKLNFSFIDFINTGYCLYFYHKTDSRIEHELGRIGEDGINIPLFQSLDEDLTYFFLKEENIALLRFLKEIDLKNLKKILSKVKTYVL